MLAGIAGVLSVVQVGNSLRMLAGEVADSAQARQLIETAIASAGQRAQVSVVAPNLEDVFVAATRNEARRPACAA